MKASRLTQEF